MPTELLDCAKIIRLRKALGLSQQMAAEKSGLLRKQAWSAIERGTVKNITLDTLKRIANALGVKAKDLLK